MVFYEAETRAYIHVREEKATVAYIKESRQSKESKCVDNSGGLSTIETLSVKA